MSLKLSWKLFIALFAAVLTGAGVLAMLSQWRLDQGFKAYINASDEALLPGLADIAAEIYERDQGWEQIRTDPRRWLRRVNLAMRMERNPDLRGERDFEQPASSENRPFRGPLGQGRPPQRQRLDGPDAGADSATRASRRDDPPRQRREGMHERLAIVDTQGALVTGNFKPKPAMPSVPVMVAGANVGQLFLLPAERVNSVMDKAFLLAQRDWLLQAVLIMLPIAAVFAYLLARHLLASVQSISAAARQLAAGDFTARVNVVGNDELSRLGSDFNVLGRALAENDGARRRWMADAAHELRTPLAVLQAEIEALQDGIRIADARALHGLHKQTLQLGALVNDLQQLALADVGALDYRMERINPDAELLAVVEAHQARFSAAGIELQLAPESPLDAQVLGDARRLHQLFDNLIENSRRYTRSPGKLVISRHCNNSHWWVHFDDSEPGVAADRCERLFDPFVRDSERLRGGPNELAGSGLGLAICRRIAQAHDAQLDASPSPHGGLRVTLKMSLSP